MVLKLKQQKLLLGYQWRHNCSVYVSYSKIWNKNRAEKLQVRIWHKLPCLLLCVAIRSNFIEMAYNKTNLTGCS